MLSSEMRVMQISFRLLTPCSNEYSESHLCHHVMYITVQSSICIRRLPDDVLHMRSLWMHTWTITLDALVFLWIMLEYLSLRDWITLSSVLSSLFRLILQHLRAPSRSLGSCPACTPLRYQNDCPPNSGWNSPVIHNSEVQTMLRTASSDPRTKPASPNLALYNYSQL